MPKFIFVASCFRSWGKNTSCSSNQTSEKNSCCHFVGIIENSHSYKKWMLGGFPLDSFKIKALQVNSTAQFWWYTEEFLLRIWWITQLVSQDCISSYGSRWCQDCKTPYNPPCGRRAINRYQTWKLPAEALVANHALHYCSWIANLTTWLDDHKEIK